MTTQDLVGPGVVLKMWSDGTLRFELMADRLHYSSCGVVIGRADAAGAAALLSHTGGHPKQQARRFRGPPCSKGAHETAPTPIPDFADGPLIGLTRAPVPGTVVPFSKASGPGRGTGVWGSRRPTFGRGFLSKPLPLPPSLCTGNYTRTWVCRR